MSSTELVKQESRAIRMQDLSPEYAEIMVLGNVLQQSGYFKDVRDQAQAVTKILFGRELGFSPIVSMGGIHIIEGKPALSSNLMATLIKRSGKYDYRVKTWDLKECVITFRENVGGKWEEVGVSSFSMDDAKTAGVGGRGAWAKFPKAMMFARALSQGMRAYCPDVSASPLYVPEEMGMEVNEDNTVKSPQLVVDLDESPTLPTKVKPLSFKKSPGPDPFTATDSAAINKDQGGITCQEGEKPSDAADTLYTAAVQTPEGQDPPADYHSAVTVSAPVEYITVNQQKNFHMKCREAVSERRKMDADNLTYQWLLDNGYYDEQDGGKVKMPTAGKIPAAGWITEREKACKWLRVQ